MKIILSQQQLMIAVANEIARMYQMAGRHGFQINFHYDGAELVTTVVFEEANQPQTVFDSTKKEIS